MPHGDVPASYRLRPPHLGDIGWIIHRQAILYNQDYGWNADFEILLAEIFVDVMKAFDPSCERGWIVEHDAETIGSVFVVRQNSETAKLRLLYVEPSARGLGVGRHLVQECIDFARAKSYKNWCYGPTTFSLPLGVSTCRRALNAWRRNRNTPSATTWSARPGNWLFDQPPRIRAGLPATVARPVQCGLPRCPPIVAIIVLSKGG